VERERHIDDNVGPQPGTVGSRLGRDHLGLEGCPRRGRGFGSEDADQDHGGRGVQRHACHNLSIKWLILVRSLLCFNDSPGSDLSKEDVDINAHKNKKRATLAVQKRSQASTLQAAVTTERKDTMM
jgi:hypothetical protein